MLGRSPRRSRVRLALGAIAACLLSVAFLAPAASADEAAWMFDPNTVVELDLGLSEAGIQELEIEPDEYVCGTIQFKVAGEVKGPPLGNVGIRLKGSFGSFEEITKKPAFKIKFDECVDDQTYFGLEKLTLNNMVQDESMVAEALTYDLFRAMDLPAPRTGYTFTRLNGEPIGVHANIETYDPISLPAWFASTKHLYEADLPDVDVVTGGAGDYEVDEGDDEDLTDLEALIVAANDEDGDWSDGMAAVADLEQMTRVWAVERYVGHWDGYAGGPLPADARPNNYYLHSEDSGIFTMLPWGTDQTWTAHLGFGEPAGGLLFNECYADTSCKALYDEALEDLQAMVRNLEYPSKAARYAALLAPCQALELETRRKYSPAELAAGAEVVIEFAKSRYIPLQEYLENTAPPKGPETANPPTEEPCSPPDSPEDPGSGSGSGSGNGSSSQPTPGGPIVERKLRFLATRVGNAFVTTRLLVPSAGKATQKVTAKFDGSRRTVCTGQTLTAKATSLVVRCRISKPALEQLESAPLRLSVKVGFDPPGSSAKFDTRSLTVPKRP